MLISTLWDPTDFMLKTTFFKVYFDREKHAAWTLVALLSGKPEHLFNNMHILYVNYWLHNELQIWNIQIYTLTME